VYLSAKADAPVDFDHRHTRAKSLSQRRIVVDVRAARLKPVTLKQVQRVLAQMASASRVEDDAVS
jgi:hypothetical protein